MTFYTLLCLRSKRVKNLAILSKLLDKIGTLAIILQWLTSSEMIFQQPTYILRSKRERHIYLHLLDKSLAPQSTLPYNHAFSTLIINNGRYVIILGLLVARTATTCADCRMMVMRLAVGGGGVAQYAVFCCRSRDLVEGKLSLL